MSIKTSEEIAVELNKVYGNADEPNKSYGKIKWVAVNDVVNILREVEDKVDNAMIMEGGFAIYAEIAKSIEMLMKKN